MEFNEADYIWVRKDRKKVDIRGVDEWYLKAIANFVGQGGGYGVTDNQIRAIYAELENRGLKGMFHVKHALSKWDERRNLERQEKDLMVDNEMLDAGDYHE